MPLADRVSVSRRFQRAIRIDTDLSDPSALAGFCLPPLFRRAAGKHGAPYFREWSRRLYVDRTLW